MFDESYIAHLIEPQATGEDELFLIEYINHEDEGKCTKSRSNLAAYCKHLTDSPESCMRVEACRWVSGALIENGQPYPSCIPCESVDTAVNSLDDIAEVTVIHNTNEYQVETKVNRAGSYHLVSGVL